jgi:hypothetical protein
LRRDEEANGEGFAVIQRNEISFEVQKATGNTMD